MNKSIGLKVFITLVIISLAVFLTVRYRMTKPEISEQVETKMKDSIAFTFDFEHASDLKNIQTVTDFKAKSGTYSAMLNDSIEYSVTFSKNLSDIPDFKLVKEVKVECSLFSDKKIQNASIVLAIDGPDGKSIHWSGDNIYGKENEWSTFTKVFPLDGSYLDNSGILKIFIWNKEKEVFYLDDLNIVFK